LIDPELVLATSSSGLGADLSKVQAAKDLAELQGNQGMQGSANMLEQRMKAENLSFSQAISTRGDDRELVGTAEQVADYLQDLFEAEACDGFVISPSMFPGMFEEFCRSVVPELQRRGLFRKEYQGTTLREHLRN
jgi:alkanesulfonate monooxygenase SsuD/methylene tetrahydromethanopterin reductase-like flavin-dependent oxidoreductase (luciferase family)